MTARPFHAAFVLVSMLWLFANPASAMLHPQQGRFMQRDPLGYVDGMGLYALQRSSPVTGADPSGMWDNRVHYTKTKDWATEANYRDECAEAIAGACDGVDDTWESTDFTSPWPGLGDLSYHFDTDKLGLTMVPGARMRNYNTHITSAKAVLSNPTALSPQYTEALSQIGQALHPYQDIDSHSWSHQAPHPMMHAPKQYCSTVLTDPNGVTHPFCIQQRKANPNWNNPHRPDDPKLWAADVEVSGQKTKSLLKSLIRNYEMLRCNCER